MLFLIVENGHELQEFVLLKNYFISVKFVIRTKRASNANYILELNYLVFILIIRGKKNPATLRDLLCKLSKALQK